MYHISIMYYTDKAVAQSMRIRVYKTPYRDQRWRNSISHDSTVPLPS